MRHKQKKMRKRSNSWSNEIVSLINAHCPQFST
nr:MAG TPA: hypothetical protein [Caudoviricetes sp.]